MARLKGLEPLTLGSEDHQRGSDPFRKFPTITDPSTAYQECVLTRSAPFLPLPSVELSRFYYTPELQIESRSPATLVAAEKTANRLAINFILAAFP